MLQTISRGYITFKPVADWKWTHTRFNFPAWLIKTAREQIAPAQKFKQILAKAIREGAESIRYFMQTLLGEHANLVMAAVKVRQTIQTIIKTAVLMLFIMPINK